VAAAEGFAPEGKVQAVVAESVFFIRKPRIWNDCWVKQQEPKSTDSLYSQTHFLIGNK